MSWDNTDNLETVVPHKKTTSQAKTLTKKDLKKQKHSLRRRGKITKKLKVEELEKIAANLLSGESATKKARGTKENIVVVNDFSFYYSKGKRQILKDINMAMKENSITTLIGPSGSGKSTLLRSINRMNDLIDGSISQGEIDVFSENIYAPGYDVTLLRTNVGMVFQKANPFPTSIYENVAYGPRAQGIKKKDILDQLVKDALEKAAIYDEVKDILNSPALGLSGGQQQRLCIARAIALHPKILLMDEPTSALDPIATLKVEELILNLKDDYTIIMVTHSMVQARRISDYTAFFLDGELVEYSRTKKMFTNPKDKRTEDYISGRYGD